VTEGPKKRMAVRVLQILLALAAAVPSIYAAGFIKSQDPPPPANTPPAFVLYVLSVITVLLLLYLFLFRPCCFSGRRRPTSHNPLSNGMMVLPIQSIPGKDGGKKKEVKSGKGNNNGANDVQVNLIVNPEAFKGKDDDSDELDEDGEWSDSTQTPRKKRRPRRRGIFAGLAMEEDWKRARKWLKISTAIDSFGMVIWGTVFVYILFGKRCPSGGFNGWCNGYNTSSAAACLLCFAFGLSIFFDVKDLSGSKASPRTRP